MVFLCLIRDTSPIRVVLRDPARSDQLPTWFRTAHAVGYSRSHTPPVRAISLFFWPPNWEIPFPKRKVGQYGRSILYSYGKHCRPRTKSTAQKGAVHISDIISRVFTNTMPLLRLACFSAFFDVLAPTIDIMHQY